ncbi:6-phosphogluconolactonase [Nitrosomonadales bacterium]|nr:6-phosphogluconolactonase [Nitrosomonadales bacterium]
MFKKNTVFLSFNSQKELDNNAVEFILERAENAIKERGIFSIVLSGGATPVNIYKLLANKKIDFTKWLIFFGDERCFPLDHPERNSFVAESIWLSKVNIPRSNIFIIPAELGSVDGSLAYDKLLHVNKSFDLVILGLGEDGHIASLFPNREWDNDKQVIAVSDSPKSPSERISLTLSRLSNSEDILFLVSGKKKLNIFRKWKEGGDLPANSISAKNQILVMSFDVS